MAFTLHPTIIFTILDCKETIIQEAVYVGCIPFHWCSFNRFSLCLSGKKNKEAAVYENREWWIQWCNCLHGVALSTPTT